MRALQVTPFFAPAFRYGGPPQSVLGLSRGLMSAGVEVNVLTTTADGDGELAHDVASRNDYEGVPVRYLRRRCPRRYFNAHGLARAMRRALSAADVVHVHGLWSFPVWIAARECRRAGVPFVVSPRGMLDDGSLAHHRWRKTLAYLAWEQRYLRRASLLHATSSGEHESLTRLALGPEIVSLPNGVSPPAVAPAARFRERLGLSSASRLVLYLGRLHPMKRLDLLLPAFDRVRAAEPDARLVLAGPRDGVDIRALIGSISDPRSVLRLGEVVSDEKWALLSEADVLVSCSDSESFGMSVVEAMAAGTPVVVTRTCPWEEVEERRAGLWVDQNVDAIAEAIVKVLRGREDALAMGDRGRELVRERYRWPAIGRAMSEHYARIVA